MIYEFITDKYKYLFNYKTKSLFYKSYQLSTYSVIIKSVLNCEINPSIEAMIDEFVVDKFYQ